MNSERATSAVLIFALAAISDAGVSGLYCTRGFVSSDFAVMISYLMAMPLAAALPMMPGFVVGYAFERVGVLWVSLVAIFAGPASNLVGNAFTEAINQGGTIAQCSATAGMDMVSVTANGTTFAVKTAVAFMAGAYLASRMRTSNHSLQARRP